MTTKYISPYNYLTIKVSNLFEDEIKSTTLDLKIRTDIRPTHHTKIYGEVIGLPRAFRDDVMPDGDILWHSEGIEDFYKIGDKVYFHYNCVLDKAKQIEDNVFFIPARRIYLKVQSDNIICLQGSLSVIRYTMTILSRLNWMESRLWLKYRRRQVLS